MSAQGKRHDFLSQTQAAGLARNHFIAIGPLPMSISSDALNNQEPRLEDAWMLEKFRALLWITGMEVAEPAPCTASLSLASSGPCGF